MLLILAAAFGTARAQSFSLPIPRNVGFNPNSAAVGDFNADGKLDVAVGNTLGGSVTIALGNGDGTFVSSIEYNTDLNPEGVAVGDFNKDGKLDLATPNSGASVSVLLGSGDGTFQAATNLPQSSPLDGPFSITAGDLNGDGNPDPVFSSSGGVVGVLLGKGDGTFQPAVSYATTGSPATARLGDFNGDAKLDVAVVNSGSSGSVGVLRGKGDGTLQAVVNFPTQSSPWGLVVADLNKDGKPDVRYHDQQQHRTHQRPAQLALGARRGL